MATAVGALDDAIKEYLVYRGFTNTLKQFETEKKDDKDKNFRVSNLTSITALTVQGAMLTCVAAKNLSAVCVHTYKHYTPYRSVELWITCFNASVALTLVLSSSSGST